MILGPRPLLVLVPLLLAGPPHVVDGDCLSFAPSVVTLEGTLGMAGGAGDMMSRGRDRDFVLLLDRPICVRTDPSARADWGDQDDIRMVQLVFASDATVKSARRLLRERIVVRGQLVAGASRMQRTAVVLEVEAVRRR